MNVCWSDDLKQLYDLFVVLRVTRDTTRYDYAAVRLEWDKRVKQVLENKKRITR